VTAWSLWEAFRCSSPDLVVLDVIGLAGSWMATGVCQELRKESDVPIVDSFTALGDVAVPDHGPRTSVADDYVVKPFRPQGTGRHAFRLRAAAASTKEQVVGIPKLRVIQVSEPAHRTTNARWTATTRRIRLTAWNSAC